MEQGALVVAPPAPTTPSAVAKRPGIDVPALLKELGFETKFQHESTLLEQVAKTTIPIEYRTLLINDRIGSIAWIDGPTAKSTFTSLKEKLLVFFSSNVTNVVDETVQQPGQPVVNRLSFLDPAISPERFVLLRIRERLYELHITPGQEKAIDPLISALMTR
jgi:hypothetical protein